MFKPLVDSLIETGNASDRLFFYLNRHIEVDEDHHGPLAEKLFFELCENNPEKISRANLIGQKCLETRLKLSDGVLEEIREKYL